MLRGWVLILLALVMTSRSFGEERRQNHLEALGLAPPFYQFWDYQTPSEQDIKAAYKTQSLLYHPDKNDQPDANDRFIAIRNAYEELKGSGPDADRRRKQAASEYSHHGLILRTLKHHIKQLPSYGNYIYKHYLIVIWWYAVALWKEFYNNPRDTWNRFIFNWNRLSMKDIVFTLLAAWLTWKVVSFCMFSVSKRVKSVFSLSEQEVRRRQRAAYLRKQTELASS